MPRFESPQMRSSWHERGVTGHWPGAARKHGPVIDQRHDRCIGPTAGLGAAGRAGQPAAVRGAARLPVRGRLAAAGRGRHRVTRDALASLVRDLRAGRLTVFAPPGTPGRKSAPKKDAARGRVIELRRAGLSVYEISARLAQEGTPLGRTGSAALREEGFGRLLRGPAPEAASARPPRPRHPAAGCRRHRLRRPARPGPHRHGRAAAGHPGPGCPGPARAGRRGRLPRHPGHPGRLVAAVPARAQLTATRRVSHVDDLLTDPAPALLAGCRSCRRRPRSPITPTGCRMTTSRSSWPPWTSR